MNKFFIVQTILLLALQISPSFTKICNTAPNIYLDTDGTTCVNACNAGGFIEDAKNDNQKTCYLSECTSEKPYVVGNTCTVVGENTRKCSTAYPYFMAGTIDSCLQSCNISTNIQPYALLENGEYACLSGGCDTTYPYLDEVTNSSYPRCLKRCPEYAYFLDIDNESKHKCLTACTNDRPYVDINLQDDKSFVCRAADKCKDNGKYQDSLTSTTIKYCVSSCKNLVPTAFIDKEGNKCVDKCESNEYIDYTTDVEKPQCKNSCSKYIDLLTNTTHPACVSSCYNLDPPAYIKIDGKTCTRECKDDGGSVIPIDYSDPKNPKCISTCTTSNPKTYKDSNTYNYPICVLSCWNQSHPKYINEEGTECVKTCDSKNIDQLTDPKNPKCATSCPGTSYVDSLTVTGINNCVYSCRNLEPTSYIEANTKTCVRPCPTEYTYIDDSDALNPKCVASCSGTNKYINPFTKLCVKTCRPMYYLSQDKTTCQKTCDQFIDQTTVFTETKANNGLSEEVVTTLYEYWCNVECPGNQYVNIDVNSVNMCVSSCKNLVPSAYITTVQTQKQCTRICSGDLKILDAISDENNPTCKSACTGNYIDEFTNVSQIICSKSCKQLLPISYVDKTDATNPKCTRKCPETSNILILNEANNWEFVCSSTCPENYYLDTLTFWNKLVCTSSCRHLIPEAYINEDQKNCTRECPITRPYLLLNSDFEYVCSSACSAAYPYIDELTVPGLIFCVQSCNDLNPPTYINSYDVSKVKCVRDCDEDTFLPYVDALTDPNNPKCADKCPTNTHIDKTVAGQMHCVKSCKNLNPTAYLYTDPDISKTTCIRKCPASAAYVNPINEDQPTCSSTCPTLYYLDNELTTDGLKICVPSCHNLIPPAYIYVDTDNNNQNTCVSQCPNSVKYVNNVDKDRPKCVASCPTHYYIDNELSIKGLKICIPSCKNLIPTSYIYADPGINKEICIRKCPADAQFINPENIDKPRCSSKCPTDYFQDNELSTPGVKICVPSCLKLEPSSYIYTDPDDKQEKCVQKCPDDAQYVEMTDLDKARCVSVCPEDYFLDNEITIKGIKMCVASCNNQNPPAFIYTDPDDSQEKCIQKCPSFAPYLEKTDPKNPRCLAACPADYYLDNEVTTPGLKICVQSCKNLNPTSYIYLDTGLNIKTCVRACPQFLAQKYVDKITDPDFPTCVSACPANHFINTITYYDKDQVQTYIIKECVSSCKNQFPTTYIYADALINKEICIASCPYNLTHKYYVDESDKDFPRCKTQCPINYYIDDLTTTGIKLCVPSCRNLEPMAYIYTDSDISKEKCIRKCPDSVKYIDKTTDTENPRCTATCPANHYIDEVTIVGEKVCVTSCKNKIPTAYLYIDTSDSNKIKCVHTCPDSVKYLDTTTDPDNPKCVSICPNNYFIDELTTPGVKLCVPSCYNLEHNFYIYQDPESNLKKCVRNCSSLTNAIYINMVDKANPVCTTTCPENYYFDQLTISGQKLCVPSCKELDPPAYLDTSSNKCVRDCSTTSYPYFDAITNINRPICVNTCGSNHILNVQGSNFCVESCLEFDQYIFIDNDDNKKTKCKVLCPNNQYIDNCSTDYYYKNPSCVSQCPEGYYIDKLTNTDKIYCVPSCKKLIPLSFIDTNIVGELQCARTCNSNNLKYIDETTNVDHPKCVSSCPTASKYIFDTDVTGFKYCVESCRLTPAKPYIDEITTPANPDCVKACRKTAPNLDKVTDPAYPKCFQTCPSTAKYLDELTDPNIPVCLNVCSEKAPYHDSVTTPAIPKCVVSCSDVGIYVDNFHCLECLASCKECSGSAENCTKCASKYYLALNLNSCLQSCPDGYYGDASDWICKDCYSTCQTCSGKLETQCTSCKDEYIFTATKECISKEQFISNSLNLEVNNITSFEELEVPLQQIKNIGNLNNLSNISTTLQTYMIETVEKSVTYLEQYVKAQSDLNNTDNQAKLANNLKKITNTTVQLPVDQISNVISEVITKINATISNETIVNNLCSTTNNVLKYMKSGSKNFNNTQASYDTSENSIFDEIEKIGNIGLKILTKDNWKTKRMLSQIFEYFIENQEFSMILESHLLSDEKWISEVKSSSSDDNFFYYEQNEKIDYEDLIKVAISYPKSFVEEINNKIETQYIETVLVKIISYNYIREASNKYKEAILDTQQIYGSVVTLSFQYQLPKSSKLNTIDMNDMSTYITVKVPINYKLNGNEDLQCMTYDGDTEEWTENNIMTAEKTDTYVICRTKSINAITVIDTQDIAFKKNYALYFAFFTIPFAILVLSIGYQLRDENSEGKKYLSFSPLFSSLTALNGAHLAAKIMLFSFQIALIGFFIALFYNFNNTLNEGEIKHVVLCIVYSLLSNYVGKYFFGVILSCIYTKSHSCALFTLFLAACYLALSFGTCYFVYNPEHDKFYNIGLYTTLIAYGIDFLAFDLFLVLVLTILKLTDDKLTIFTYGGYLSLNKNILVAKQAGKYCISEENPLNLQK